MSRFRRSHLKQNAVRGSRILLHLVSQVYFCFKWLVLPRFSAESGALHNQNGVTKLSHNWSTGMNLGPVCMTDPLARQVWPCRLPETPHPTLKSCVLSRRCRRTHRVGRSGPTAAACTRSRMSIAMTRAKVPKHGGCGTTRDHDHPGFGKTPDVGTSQPRAQDVHLDLEKTRVPGSGCTWDSGSCPDIGPA